MKDVLIYADPGTVEHKLEGELPDGHNYCFWSVNGTPRQTGPGAAVLFCDNERVHARGTVLEIVVGELRFTPLERVDEPLPDDPVTRGFKYVKSCTEAPPG